MIRTKRTTGLRWALTAGATALVACATPAPASPWQAHPAAGHIPSQGQTLASAMREGRDLGPIDGAQQLRLTLELARRNGDELQAIINSGAHVSPAELGSRFGPDPGAVAAVERLLSGAGLQTRWTPGQPYLFASGSARGAEALFDVEVHNFVAPDGTRFRAPLRAPAVPASLRGVTAVLGFDTFPALRHSAIRHGDGLQPTDIAAIYNLAPLQNAHLDGTGMTVAFPESSIPQQDALDKYASQFGLPAFHVVTKTDASWGPAAKPGDQGFNNADGETEMDLEIVHAIAPGAQEVVYAGAGGGPDQLPILFQAIAHDFPNAIVSSSLGINACEQDQYKNDEIAFDTAWKTMAAQGTTAYDASGDFGAYCGPGQVGVYPDVASPNVTSVGGTTVFQASNGGYASEAAWGDPVNQIGDGGGVSAVWQRPSWQKGPGVQAKGSNGMRQIPDISGPGDPISPWYTVNESGPAPIGGTSAAAPFWAGLTALIYQDLAAKHLGHPGLIAPVLYLFAQSPGGMPSNPFHDVTTGSNLYYAAGPGWDFATGLGTPDIARLADDLLWFEQTHPPGAGG